MQNSPVRVGRGAPARWSRSPTQGEVVSATRSMDTRYSYGYQNGGRSWVARGSRGAAGRAPPACKGAGPRGPVLCGSGRLTRGGLFCNSGSGSPVPAGAVQRSAFPPYRAPAPPKFPRFQVGWILDTFRGLRVEIWAVSMACYGAGREAYPRWEVKKSLGMVLLLGARNTSVPSASPSWQSWVRMVPPLASMVFA